MNTGLTELVFIIARNRSVIYENDPEGVAINFKAVGRAVSKAVQAESMEEVFDDNWSEEIVEYKKNSCGRKKIDGEVEKSAG